MGDMRTMFDCIRASSGNSLVWETGGPMLMQGTYDPSFSLALQCKDNRLGYQIATKHRVPLEILGHAMRRTTRQCTPTETMRPATPPPDCWRRRSVSISDARGL